MRLVNRQVIHVPLSGASRNDTTLTHHDYWMHEIRMGTRHKHLKYMLHRKMTTSRLEGRTLLVIMVSTIDIVTVAPSEAMRSWSKRFYRVRQ